MVNIKSELLKFSREVALLSSLVYSNDISEEEYHKGVDQLSDVYTKKLEQ